MSTLYVNDDLARKLLELHEGRRRDPYDDLTGQTIRELPSGGLVTIGIGRNLSSNGLTDDEVDVLFAHDLSRVVAELGAHYPWMTQLDQVRVLALVDLCFNLGLPMFQRFQPTLDLIRAGEYRTAKLRLMRTPWFDQTRTRAVRVTQMIETGEWPSGLARTQSA